MIKATKEGSSIRDNRRHVESLNAIYSCLISPLVSDDVFVLMTIVMSGLMTVFM